MFTADAVPARGATVLSRRYEEGKRKEKLPANIFLQPDLKQQTRAGDARKLPLGRGHFNINKQHY